MHARDLAHALHLVIEKAPLGTTYNVGPPEPTSIRDLVIKTAQAMGKTLEDVAEEVPDRLGQDSQYWLDSSAIARDTGWKMQIGLDEGLAEMVDWGRTYLNFLKDYTADYDWRA